MISDYWKACGQKAKPMLLLRRRVSSVCFAAAMSSPSPFSSSHRINLIHKLLKGIETGDPEAATVVSEQRYVQHNPQKEEGGPSLATLFQRLSKSNPRVNLVRFFEDGNYVFGMTEYDFASRRVGFEVFRFGGDLAVEHWDNIQPRPLGSDGDFMVDGTAQISPSEVNLTEQNRQLVNDFVETIFVQRQKVEELEAFIDSDKWIQHSPHLGRTVSDMKSILQAKAKIGGSTDDTASDTATAMTIMLPIRSSIKPFTVS